MKRLVLSLALTCAVALPAQAGCYADYKAKQDRPLRLHYGVIQLPDAACGNRGQARQIISSRLSAAGWQLLNIVSLFGDDGLAQREANAGAYFLRF